MPRVGQNPKRGKPAEARFQPIVLAVVTHLPNQEGYHKERFEVVKACIDTMTRGANLYDFSLLVWDNGSCRDFRDWLQYTLRPNTLVLSENVGKTTARTSLFRMVHPDTIVCYSDDDMLYSDGWLAPQLELLNNFPNVSAVTGYPVRTSFRWGNENTLRWARKNAKLETGRFLPDEWENDFAESIGRDMEYHRQNTLSDMDYRITYKGRQAYATAHHCQFIARAGTIDRILQYDGQAMGEERIFDTALDSIGLRLATTERLCRHIGNVMIRSETWLQV